MLRKLIVFAITSGLAGKLWKTYRSRNTARGAGAAQPTARPTAPPDRQPASPPRGNAPV